MIFFVYAQDSDSGARVFLLVPQVHAVRHLKRFLSTFSFKHGPVVEVAKGLCPNELCES